MEFAMGSEGTTVPLMEVFSTSYDLDDIFGDASIEELAGISENDLRINSFDVKARFDTFSEELAAKQEDYSDLFDDVVKANKEVAITQMNFHVSDEDILQGVDKESVLMIPSKVSRARRKTAPASTALALTDRNQRVRKDKKVDLEEPVLSNKKIKIEVLDDEEEQDTKKSIPQFVFVNDTVTNQKKVITIRKGEKVPERYTVVSIREGMPSNELATVGVSTAALPTLQDLVTRTASKCNQQATKPPIELPSCSTNTLNPLSDLMSIEMQKKSRLKYKQREGANAQKVISLMTNGANQPSSISGTPQENAVKDVAKVENAKEVTSVSLIKPSASVVPVGQTTTTSSSSSSPATSAGKGQYPLFCCKICREYFFPNFDNRFRKHMFIKHGIEIINDNEFEDSKVYPKLLLKCKKCNVVALNKRDEHRMKCLPLLSEKDAFEEVLIWSNEQKYKCGVNNCREAFDMRYKLRHHINLRHQNVASLMIVDPDFRCGRCLKRFTESHLLGQHVGTCIASRPNSETVLELAKSLLYCDYCEKAHNSLADATGCYLNRVVFRCVLCMTVSKDKKNFYRHLHVVHNLEVDGQRFKIECPFCDFGPDKYTVIFPHIVMEHYNPALAASNQVVVVNPATQQVRTSSRAPVIPVDPLSLDPPRTPALRTTVGPSVLTSTPTGCIINTNRLVPTMSMSQFLTPQNNIYLKVTPALPNNTEQIFAVSPRQVGAVVPRTALNIGQTVQTSANVSPALSVPASGLFKLIPSPPSRAPQVGYVRPLPQPITSTKPILLRTSFTTGQPQPAISGIPGVVSVAPSSLATNGRPAVAQQVITPITVVRGNVTNLSSARTVPIAPRPTVIGLRAPPTLSMPSSQQQQQQRYVVPSGSSTSVSASPVGRVTALHNHPTSTTTTTQGLGSNTSSNPSSTASVTTAPRTSQADNSTSESTNNSPRIVTINGRTYEYVYDNPMIQNLHNRLTTQNNTARKSTSATIRKPTSTTTVSMTHMQSPSGLTVARHPLPNQTAPFGIAVQSASTIRPPVIATSTTTNPQQSRPTLNETKPTFQQLNDSSSK